ncbi:uncharacterized protein CCOS01_08002 [Colletotrichum costaricense]|uniref:Uncharacterized protein n=1 Tax=Colletotrichum costaricense TaxID=1209916 RepID=A0AAI9YZ08_9PEZI|nr:uncharacterized protein CCOS01_08002 [Colletotrichum costaricense]KAK1527740.1 hypothetical protein CCOS01_08002 [Colletotrichum costaricense]
MSFPETQVNRVEANKEDYGRSSDEGRQPLDRQHGCYGPVVPQSFGECAYEVDSFSEPDAEGIALAETVRSSVRFMNDRDLSERTVTAHDKVISTMQGSVNITKVVKQNLTKLKIPIDRIKEISRLGSTYWIRQVGRWKYTRTLSQKADPLNVGSINHIHIS